MGKKNRKMLEAAAGNQTVDKYIDVLDGIRAISIVIVIWFHFWQSTWLTPYINFDNTITRYFGIYESHLHTYIRYGAAFVETIIVISAICNLWPYARSIVLKEPWPDTITFWKKRAIRVFPSYYLCILVMFIVALVGNKYPSSEAMWRDLLTRVTFLCPWKGNWYLNNTNLNGALWTVQVEVWLYLLIPLFAKLFRKWPAVACGIFWLVGIVSTNAVLVHCEGAVRSLENFPLMYAGFLPCGMLICICYALIKKANIENRYTWLFSFMIIIGSLVAFDGLVHTYKGVANEIIRVEGRFDRMILFSILIFAIMLAGPVVKKIFANRILKFVATISYNMYIWHQVIAFWCKEYKIPYWEGEKPPNQLGDTAWSWKYQIIILVLTMIVSVALTYGFELPVAKYLRKKWKV